MGEERWVLGSWWGNRREGDHWGDLGVDGRIILERISSRWDVCWIGLAQDRDVRERRNEPSGSVKCGEFLD